MMNGVFFFFLCVFFCQAEDGIRDLVRSRGLGDVYKRQGLASSLFGIVSCSTPFTYSALMDSAFALCGNTKLRSNAVRLNSRRVHRSSLFSSSTVCSPRMVRVSSTISSFRSFLSNPGACISNLNASLFSVMFTRGAWSCHPSLPRKRPMCWPKISLAKRSTGEAEVTGDCLYFISVIVCLVFYFPRPPWSEF